MSQPDNDRQRVAIAQAIKAAMDLWPAQVELIALKARTAKARYDALRRVGFSAGEAIQLCIKDVEL